VKIRAAEARDAAAMAAIYNEGVAGRQATFDTGGKTPAEVEERIGSERHPSLVAERDGEVVGFAWASPYSVRDVYAGVAECSVYISSAARRSGVGLELLDALAAESERRGLYKLIGLIFTFNDASVRLFEKAGFREVGVHHRHGKLEGTWCDVRVSEKLLGEAAESG
jgi:phosphinothricin acetyltransferase